MNFMFFGIFYNLLQQNNFNFLVFYFAKGKNNFKLWMSDEKILFLSIIMDLCHM